MMAGPSLRRVPPAATPYSVRRIARAATTRRRAVDTWRAALRRHLGVVDVRLAATGRAALHSLLETLAREHPGRRDIVMPAYTCPSLVVVCRRVGLRPRLVDIAPHTWLPTPADVAARLSAETLAYIHVHPFGIPLPAGDLVPLVRAAGARFIDDAAQAFGAREHGRHAGTNGDFGLLSFGPGKPLSTAGGGAIVAGRPETAAIVAAAWRDAPSPQVAHEVAATVRLVAFAAALQPRVWGLLAALGAQRIGASEASWGYQLAPYTQFQARIGLALLPQLETIAAARGAAATALLGATPERWRVAVAPAAEPAYTRLPLIVDTPAQREALIGALTARGIGAGRLYGATLATLFPELAEWPFPGAERIAATLLTLPVHHGMRAADLAATQAILASHAARAAGSSTLTDSDAGHKQPHE